MSSHAATSRRVFARLLRSAGRVALLYLLAIVMFSLACLAGCADRLILFPTREAIETPAARVMVDAPAGPLEIWSDRTPAAWAGEPEAFVLAYIGNGSRAEREASHLLALWADHPVEIWAVNYPGYGGSAGDARLRAIPPAALAAYDALAMRARRRPIFVQGHSLGTAVALHVATHRPVAGAVLHNPPPLRQLILGRFGWWNLWLAAGAVARAIPPEMDSLANGRACGTVPAVFLLAGRDTLVTPTYQKRVADAYAGPKRIVALPEAGHNDAIEGRLLTAVRSEVDWLWGRAALP